MEEKHKVSDYLAYLGASLPSDGHGWRKMRCPFHEDRTASSAINFELNRFKCHGCGVAGDIYDLIKHKRGGTLNEAIEFAQTISTSGNPTVRFSNRGGKRLSPNPSSLGRRGTNISSRGSS